MHTAHTPALHLTDQSASQQVHPRIKGECRDRTLNTLSFRTGGAAGGEKPILSSVLRFPLALDFLMSEDVVQVVTVWHRAEFIPPPDAARRLPALHYSPHPLAHAFVLFAVVFDVKKVVHVTHKKSSARFR